VVSDCWIPKQTSKKILQKSFINFTIHPSDQTFQHSSLICLCCWRLTLDHSAAMGPGPCGDCQEFSARLRSFLRASDIWNTRSVNNSTIGIFRPLNPIVLKRRNCPMIYPTILKFVGIIKWWFNDCHSDDPQMSEKCDVQQLMIGAPFRWSHLSEGAFRRFARKHISNSFDFHCLFNNFYSKTVQLNTTAWSRGKDVPKLHHHNKGWHVMDGTESVVDGIDWANQSREVSYSQRPHRLTKDRLLNLGGSHVKLHRKKKSSRCKTSSFLITVQ